MNEQVDTYLDAEATLTRLRNMDSQAGKVKDVLDGTKGVMEDLTHNFTGVSATNLQKEYNDVAETFKDFHNYLQSKIIEMETLTGNITTTDER